MSRSFTGTNSLTNASAPITSGPVTMVAWVKASSLVNFAGIIEILKTTSSTEGVYLASMANGTARAFIENTGTDVQINQTGIVAGTWTFVAVTTNAVNAHACWVNSTKTTSTTASAPSGMTNMAIGTKGGVSFSGLIAYAAVWNSVLGDTQIQNMASGLDPAGIGTPVAYWPLNDTGSTESDHAGSFTLTVNGATHSTDNPTIIPFGSLTIATPSTVTIGVPSTITWTSVGTVSNNLTIAISKDGGATFTNIFTGVSNTGSQSWTPTGIPSATCQLKITDANNILATSTSGSFTTLQASSGNLPLLVSGQITSNSGGKTLSLVFDRNVNYNAGSATISATPYIGQTAKRTITTVGSPTGGGTTTLVFTLRRGKPVMVNETGITINLPLGLVIDSLSSTYVNNLSSGVSITNNSTRTYAPMARIISKPLDDFTGTYLVEAEGSGHFGLNSVQLSITDGTNTLGPVTVSGRTPLANARFCSIGVFAHSFNLASLLDGQCTVHLSATCPVTGGVQTDSIVIWNNSGGSLTTTTYYVEGISGNDSTGNGSVGNPYKTIQKVILAAHGNTSRTKIILNEAATYDAFAGYAGFNLSTGRTLYVTSGGSLGTSVIVSGDANGIKFQSNIPVILYNVAVQVSQISDPENVAPLTWAVPGMLDTCTIYNKASLTNVTGAYTWGPNPNGSVLWYCTCGPINTGPSNTALLRGTSVVSTSGDFTTGLVGAMVDCETGYRGQCRVSATIFSTISGATIGISTSASNFIYTTNDSVNGTQTFNAGTSAGSSTPYNTVALLCAGIAALTGWTATATTSDVSLNPAKCYATLDQNGAPATVPASISPLSLELGLYGVHSDGWQQYVSSSNVVFSGLTQIPFPDTYVLGASDQQQDFWFDHDPSFTIDGLLVANVEFPHMALNPTRSGLNGNGNPITDFLMMYVTMPYSYLDLIDNGGAGEPLIPDNIAIMYSTFRGMSPEQFATPGITVDPDEFWLIGLNWNEQTPPYSGTNGGNIQLLASNYADVTVHVSSGEFVSLTPSALNLTPLASGHLVNRVPVATGMTDIAGKLRLVNGAIGAVEMISSPICRRFGNRGGSRGVST